MEPRGLTRWDVHKIARCAYEVGVRYIGGCCGYKPYHIRAIAEEVRTLVKAGEKLLQVGRLLATRNRTIFGTIFERKRGAAPFQLALMVHNHLSICAKHLLYCA